MKWLMLYLVNGFPTVAVSHRPIDKHHSINRVYHKLSGSTVIRFITTNHNIVDFNTGTPGTEVVGIELRGGGK